MTNKTYHDRGKGEWQFICGIPGYQTAGVYIVGGLMAGFTLIGMTARAFSG